MFKRILLGVVCVCAVFGGQQARGADYVRGYVRPNGTYVAPYHRTHPDHNFSNNWLSNSFPRSETMIFGQPYRHTNLLKRPTATCSGVLWGIEMNSAHLVMASIITRIHLFDPPCTVSGPKRSMCTLSKTSACS